MYGDGGGRNFFLGLKLQLVAVLVRHEKEDVIKTGKNKICQLTTCVFKQNLRLSQGKPIEITFLIHINGSQTLQILDNQTDC